MQTEIDNDAAQTAGPDTSTTAEKYSTSPVSGIFLRTWALVLSPIILALALGMLVGIKIVKTLYQLLKRR